MMVRTYFLISIDHPENVDVDRLRASFEGGQNVKSFKLIEHSETFPTPDEGESVNFPYIAF